MAQLVEDMQKWTNERLFVEKEINEEPVNQDLKLYTLEKFDMLVPHLKYLLKEVETKQEALLDSMKETLDQKVKLVDKLNQDCIESD